MRRWLLLTGISLLIPPASPRGFGAGQTGTPPATKSPSHSPKFDVNAHEEGQGGILYGKGWAFMIAAPKGWMMDDQGNGGQVNVAFYRRGESFDTGDATMYGMVVAKVKSEDDTLQKVIRWDIQSSRKADPGLKAQPAAPLETADGRKAVVYTFSGRGVGRTAEKVAYIDTPHFVIMVALTAQSEKAYRAALPDFARLVHSFGFFTGGVQFQQAKLHSAKGSKKGR